MYRRIHKVYPGDIRAVIDLNLNVNEGEIFGLLGPNGAGKTTTSGCLRRASSRPRAEPRTTRGLRSRSLPWLQTIVLLNPLVYMSEGMRVSLTPWVQHMSLWGGGS